jgi:hypothetical protein
MSQPRKIKRRDKKKYEKMFASLKLQLDALNSAKIGKMADIGYVLYCSFKYIKIFFASCVIVT